MCFSNLPVEFDENGNPYLADEADDVARMDRTSADDAPVDEDPESVYAAIVEDLPESVARELTRPADSAPRRDDQPKTTEVTE